MIWIQCFCTFAFILLICDDFDGSPLIFKKDPKTGRELLCSSINNRVMCWVLNQLLDPKG